MNYSLLSRFQGALFGSIIAEILVSCHFQSSLAVIADEQLSPWSQIRLDILENLLDSGYLSEDDWQKIYHRHENILDAKDTANSSQIALAMLPLMVFFHDSLSFLREQLQQATAIWQYPPELREDVLIWSYAMALGLKKQLNSPNLIEQLLPRCAAFQTPLVAKLEQVQTLLFQGTSLQQAVAQLSRHSRSPQTAIALALYCFGYTPEDFRLCLNRAWESGYQPRTTVALTGALAGAYNSFYGIPAYWRLLILKHPVAVENTQQIEQLFPIWAGVYQADSNSLGQMNAIASPQIIQPRTSLKIISQKPEEF